MKRILLLLAFAGALSMTFAQKSAYTIDTQGSSLKWEAKKVIGGHVGTIQLQSGQVQTQNGQITGGSFQIDMNSLVCTDAPKLTGHLKNEDFFDVPNHPTATFVITKVDNSKPSPVITGNLTIKNITKSISFPAKVIASTNGMFEAEAKGIKVNRLDYDIKYRSASFFSDLGNRAIADDFTLDVHLKAQK